MKKKLVIAVLAILVAIGVIVTANKPKNINNCIEPPEERVFVIRTNRKPMPDTVVYGFGIVKDDNGDRQLNNQKCTQINDFDEFRGLVIMLNKIYDCEYGSPNSINDLINNYNEEYFENNRLLVIPIDQGSGSNRISYNHIDVNGNFATIYVDIEAPEVGTCDMAYWLMFIEIDSEYYKDVNFFDVIIH